MLEETMGIFNPWWYDDYRSPGVIRDYYLDEIKKGLDIYRAVILYGLRRTGKTTIMKQSISKNIKKYGCNNILFISMDHPEVVNTSIIDILRTFRRLNKIERKEKVMLYIDEIHFRKDFEKELKAIVDSEDNVSVIASGSSTLQIMMKSPAMTGRYKKINVNPLSFKEYLKFKNKEYKINEPQAMEGLMEDYLVFGGMPLYVLTGDPEVIIEAIDDIIYKDIAISFEIRDPLILKNLFLMLMERVGNQLTYSSISRILGISVDSVRKYIGFFQQSGLIYLVEKYGTPNERKASPKKCFTPDNGIKTVFAGRGSMGSLAENQVFNTIKKNNHNNIYYYNKNKREIDFITKDMAIEVKYLDSLIDKDIEPFKGLNLKGIKRKIIVTKRALSEKRVENIPLWRIDEMI